MKTQLMGILNATPDSFFDKGKYFNHEKAIERALEMIKEGVDILDIGGESTRPNATPVSEQEERQRVIPLIQTLRTQTDVSISIDTMKPKIAHEALKAGANFINDIQGLKNDPMIEVASSYDVPVCIMHMQGSPQTMQQQTHYEEDIISYLIHWFKERIKVLTKKGIKEKNIIIDPGIGFGKTVADNLKIIHNLSKFKDLGYPVLLGVSRKSFMGKIVNHPSNELLAPTLAINTIAVLSAVDIIRVHDIKEHRMIIDLLDRFRKEEK